MNTRSLLLLTSILAAGAPGIAAAQAGDAGPVLERARSVYGGAKGYDATWKFTMEVGGVVQKAVIEIKAQGPGRLFYRLRADGRPKLPNGVPAVPEMSVVADGKAAWFENTTEKLYFKAPLPPNPESSPLMFFPRLDGVDGLKRETDIVVSGRTLQVLTAPGPGGGTLRMEVDAADSHIKRIVSEVPSPGGKVITTIQADREAFDAKVPDSAFAYKPPRGSKEIPAPPGAEAVFSRK